LFAAPVVGCGGSGKTSSTASSSVSAAASSTTTSSTSTHTTTHRRHKTAHRAASTTAISSSGGVSTAPPPTPAGTPPAPDGLRQTTGYDSYDLCGGACTGAVPASLRRPLHLPHGCAGPSTGSPVAPQGGADLRLTQFIGSPWAGARVTWIAPPTYTGPVLIRARRTDGAGAVGFGEGHVPFDELQMLGSGQQAPPPPPGGRSWLSFTRVRGPGCYAYQVDGTTFSRVIAFRAR
jgi:hypothetical protein